MIVDPSGDENSLFASVKAAIRNVERDEFVFTFLRGVVLRSHLKFQNILEEEALYQTFTALCII